MARVEAIDESLRERLAEEDGGRSILVELPDKNVARDNIGRLLRRVLDHFNREFSGRMGDLGYDDIRPRHATVFAHLDPSGTRSSELAARAGMTRQSMGEMVAELVGSGYLDQRPDPNDGRAKVVLLTPRGLQHLKDARRIADEIQWSWENRLGKERMREVRVTLEELASMGRA